MAWSYDPELDIRGHRAGVVLESGVVRPLTAADEFQTAKEAYEEIQGWLTPLLAVAVAALTGAAVLLIWLCSGAGAEPDGTASLRGQDRIPLECYLMLQAVAFSVLRSAGDPILFYLNGGSGGVRLVVGLGTLSVAGAGLVLALCLTLAARVRSRMLLKNTLCWRLWAAVTGWAARTARHWPVTRRAVWAFALYLTGTFVTSFTVVLIPIYQGAVLWAVCRWVRQWSAIRAATAQIVGGGPEVKIDTRGMFWDLRTHAEQLNDLGQAITNAVEGRLKSERFKTELITNVSHDLKTPLTSIINYVDLMKKEDIQNPKAKEYLEVLERKSQRLKKLTEDLVEASKASSGSLPVNLARLEFGQLLRQAMGEYEEKFQQAGLTAVIGGADSSTAVLADGRHLWRVIDNLLGNCCKYALPGTRVYLDLERDGEMVVLAVKNISQNPLNIPPEQLMERFVRGEASRTTEGSGLGLSIARSLTELQHGTFRLSIDGDLFKAAVAMPACPAEPPALPAAEI
ncbi:sensor histidine kinase [Pseudoflavonifractor sp. 524-17]|nr:sensor histidine kinase [Pseudoflavonifractor sp. 524-17]